MARGLLGAIVRGAVIYRKADREGQKQRDRERGREIASEKESVRDGGEEGEKLTESFEFILLRILRDH